MAAGANSTERLFSVLRSHMMCVCAGEFPDESKLFPPVENGAMLEAVYKHVCVHVCSSRWL